MNRLYEQWLRAGAWSGAIVDAFVVALFVGLRLVAWVLLAENVLYLCRRVLRACCWWWREADRMPSDKKAIIGKGSPSDDIGAINDWYFDEEGKQWYGPKIAAGWFAVEHYGPGVAGATDERENADSK